MMFKLWKREFEEAKMLHNIEIQKKNAEIEIHIDNKKNELDLLKKNLVSEHDLKLREAISLLRIKNDERESKLKAEHKAELEKVKDEYKKKFLDEKEALLSENYSKLSTAMQRLHEDGNVTTRFTQDLALKMMEGMPTAKMQTKVITDGKSS